MRVSVIILPFRKTEIIKPVFDAILAQTHKDLEVIAVINDPADGSKEVIQKNHPQVKIIEPGWNSWFAAGNNLGIKASSGEFIQLVNDDLILEPTYIEEALKAFADPKVAAATGKILRYDFRNNRKTKIIDTVGVSMSKSGRARDIGQNQEDKGQFDYALQTTHYNQVFGVSGAGPMYRRSALERVKYCYSVFASEAKQSQIKIAASPSAPCNDRCEFFDESFFAYWEDVDLSWRFNNAGYKNVYVPAAVAYHGRTAGQAAGGYLHLLKFIKHHSKLSSQVKRLNYKNHILMYVKNTKYIHPLFILRELAMLAYVLVFETSTLKVVPELFRQIPQILKKRKQWQSN
ncbi:MAG: hypothetical protein A3J07_00150 [Candidatus Doudnabacteria bacterium RIFCSPLOWO2_02_FULL_49_13]|uniref:Glycosyltransferase 2-like domain-containing protein n=1 Tax=Candidatus Doudnabacteria bacterium RIFCSPHIGHO2_12_FULL_48_16 TaxID=1817838 RepID=A0A1F5PJC5_9BACT|nr:MAG: hypothetical protein A3B77_03790 [Candidatus Doudnabacteria bacterium RIFCSPHIGHO2_02_FULL_49_24]OGE88597.1 MAG: hypothetical protein A2760_04275 [Candidatus Doudnabacteria bacterium RIFCSPHIGHO2_01_FULL_50_67]OGE89772.1 MAG: hypothetical protein A3E29_00070 [Candidatus Doudnabacteria bacterium RIFCSPHIGHO2_12_FULL_48_16]OGE96751.1 MAG: hypothetical protein A2990_03050 [Candidatus Doudnabacteria bacterium RIFCSPLOWO2_01_FULL_49_40]OGF02775.1 MAG: hypothetical protein A3J07_00150 [Candid